MNLGKNEAIVHEDCDIHVIHMELHVKFVLHSGSVALSPGWRGFVTIVSSPKIINFDFFSRSFARNTR